MVKWCELEVADEAQQLLVRCWFTELSVCLGSIRGVFAVELERFDDGVRDLLDTDFLIFSHYVHALSEVT